MYSTYISLKYDHPLTAYFIQISTTSTSQLQIKVVLHGYMCMNCFTDFYYFIVIFEVLIGQVWIFSNPVVFSYYHNNIFYFFWHYLLF